MRGVESLRAVRVTGSVGVFGALGACKKHVKSYSTAKFDSLKDALLAAAGMRPDIGFYIFCASSQNLCQVAKITKTYTTVRFCFRRDTLLAAPDMRPDLGIDIFCASSQNVVQVAKTKKTYTTVRCSFCKDTLLAGPRVHPGLRF